MTENNEQNEDALITSPAVHEFVLRWGDMGAQWGMNRSVAQVHALLYASDRPLTAEDIAEQLAMARSNVSTSLRELLAWQLIRRAPVLGDRRDHFEAETDLWTMLVRITSGRKQRELDPAAAALRTCVAHAQEDERLSEVSQARLNGMLGFVEELSGWYDEMLALPPEQLIRLVRLGTRVTRVFEIVRGGRRRSAD
jgi:DNA-binding transcriptional regulator GbsR (MarR family)